MQVSAVRYAKFESIRYLIDIDIMQNCRIDINIDIFKIVLIDIDIDIFKIVLIDIDIFQECRYIDNRYFISIYRTGLPPEIELLTVYVRQSSNCCEWKQSYIWLVVRTHSR